MQLEMPHAVSSWQRFCSTCLKQNEVCKIICMTLPSCAVAVDVFILIWSKQMCLVGEKSHCLPLCLTAISPKDTVTGFHLLQSVPKKQPWEAFSCRLSLSSLCLFSLLIQMKVKDSIHPVTATTSFSMQLV